MHILFNLFADVIRISFSMALSKVWNNTLKVHMLPLYFIFFAISAKKQDVHRAFGQIFHRSVYGKMMLNRDYFQKLLIIVLIANNSGPRLNRSFGQSKPCIWYNQISINF